MYIYISCKIVVSVALFFFFLLGHFFCIQGFHFSKPQKIKKKIKEKKEKERERERL
jgi:hypothetical protein